MSAALRTTAAQQSPSVAQRSSTGERTLPVRRATTAGVAALVPHAKVLTVPDSGHGVHRDNPAAFNEVVLRFFWEASVG